MRALIKSFVAAVAGLTALGLMSANAARPDYCDINHDHRSHNADYYDYYDADSYYRAGPYRGGDSRFSVTVRNDRYDRYDRYDRRDRHYDRGRRNGYGDGRVINREVYDTRYRARIILTEEIVRGRRGRVDLVCTVKVRGPEAGYVPERRLYRIARRECSRDAQIRVYA